MIILAYAQTFFMKIGNVLKVQQLQIRGLALVFSDEL
jgi:hypothetical protein